jgi:lipopolysaccharide biosynthesis regulator YciM
MRSFVTVLTLLFCLNFLAPSAGAQTSHAASQAAIDEALQQHSGSVEADRHMVLQLLERPEVRALAGQMGLDLRRAQAAIAATEGAELADLAAQARTVDEALAGGQSRITISTTLLIIALLVIILLVVALK